MGLKATYLQYKPAIFRGQAPELVRGENPNPGFRCDADRRGRTPSAMNGQGGIFLDNRLDVFDRARCAERAVIPNKDLSIPARAIWPGSALTDCEGPRLLRRRWLVPEHRDCHRSIAAKIVFVVKDGRPPVEANAGLPSEPLDAGLRGDSEGPEGRKTAVVVDGLCKGWRGRGEG